MSDVVRIVDSHDYVRSNCYQKQLTDAFERLSKQGSSFTDITIDELLHRKNVIDNARSIISCLKQRTIDGRRFEIKNALGARELMVYDQDPWESFRSESPCHGSYERIATELNVKAFAVTTHAWTSRIERAGHRAKFVRMGLSPSMCSKGPPRRKRSRSVAFIGTIHGYRSVLFDSLRRAGVNVDVRTNCMSHTEYLDALSDVAVFIHRESFTFEHSGETIDLAEGLWAKDVEALGRGCISIRNFHEDFERHVPAKLSSLRLYHTTDEAVHLVRHALHALMDDASDDVEIIRTDDAWLNTARDLTC